MRVAYLTTWGSQCGIATYSEELLSYLPAEVQPMVLATAELGSCIRETPAAIPVKQAWVRTSGALLEQVQPFLDTPPGFDIIHIQHEYGLFMHQEAFIRALRAICGKPNRKVVLTLHTVFPRRDWYRAGFIDAVCRLADAIIVHTYEGLSSLALARDAKAKIACIPHGIEPRAPGDARHGLEVLGVPERMWGAILEKRLPVGLTMGFQGPNKGTERLIAGFAHAVSRNPDVGIYVICGESSDETYPALLRGTVVDTGYEGRFVLNRTFVKPEDVASVMAAVDYGLLNGSGRVLSASGSSRMFIGCGVPLACANVPIYSDAIGAGALPFDPGEMDSMSSAILAMATSPQLREAMRTSFRQKAQALRWEVIAENHVALYRSLLP